MESATRGSRRVFFAFSELSFVPIKMRSPSRETHTGADCGEPSGNRLARWAKLGPSRSRLISSDKAMPMVFSFAGEQGAQREECPGHHRSSYSMGRSVASERPLTVSRRRHGSDILRRRAFCPPELS